MQLLLPPFFHNRSVSFWNLPPAFSIALRGAIGGRHHRWPQGGSRNLPHCWCLLGSHQNPPASSEQPPGRPKLNKGLLELLGVAACPTWALHCQEALCHAGQGRNLSGEKGPQVSLFPALHREGGPEAHRTWMPPGSLQGATRNQDWQLFLGKGARELELGRLTCPLLEPWDYFLFFTMSMNYPSNEDDRS